MKSAVVFQFYKPGIDVNKEINAYLQKYPGWEVVSVSHQIIPATGVSVALGLKNHSQQANAAQPEMTAFSID